MREFIRALSSVPSAIFGGRETQRVCAIVRRFYLPAYLFRVVIPFLKTAFPRADVCVGGDTRHLSKFYFTFPAQGRERMRAGRRAAERNEFGRLKNGGRWQSNVAPLKVVEEEEEGRRE